MAGFGCGVGFFPEGEGEGDQFGYSVSLSADGWIEAAGGPFNDVNSSDAGFVKMRVFDLYKYGPAYQLGSIYGEAAGDQSGYSVSISCDGTKLLSGAPFSTPLLELGPPNDTSFYVENGGQANDFELISGVWTASFPAVYSSFQSNERAGWSVSLSCDKRVTSYGAPFNWNYISGQAGVVGTLTCDGDGDGFLRLDCNGTDCDDRDSTIHPGAAEICNGVDDDCDGMIDEGGACSIVYVNGNATGLNNGNTWANAYTNLQSAIDNTNPGVTQI